jgi:hypothetical protein
MMHAMKEAGFLLLVRFWIAPQAEGQALEWLEGAHVAEVLRQPGFLWCRRVRVTEPAADGWAGYAMIYGIESRAAFDAYEGNALLKAKFARERAPFEKYLRIERFAGQVDMALERS